MVMPFRAAVVALALLPTLAVAQEVKIGSTVNTANQSGTAVLPTGTILGGICADGSACILPIYGFATAPSVATYRAGGTNVAKTAAASGDVIGTHDFYAYNGTLYVLGARLQCAATAAWTASVNPAACAFTVPLRKTSNTYAAAGTTLAAATAVTTEIAVITSGTGGVSLPAYNASLGGVQPVSVSNISGATQNVYPPSASVSIWNLNGSTAAGTAGAAQTIANGVHQTYECYSTTQCLLEP